MEGVFLAGIHLLTFLLGGGGVNGPPHFEIDLSIFGMGVEIVFLLYMRGGICYFHYFILIPIHWRAKVTKYDVYAHILRLGCSKNAIPQDFGRRKIGGRCSDFAWVCDEVSTRGEAEPVWVLLLWVIINYQSSICDKSIGRDFSYFLMGEYE